MLCPFGDLPLGEVVPFPFPAYDSAGASVTITGLAVTDVEIYSGVSMTQRASDNGISLIDTDGIDLDGRVGIHGFSVDFSDNSDAGFYAAGTFYWLVVDAVTVDSQTVRFIYTFSLGFNLRPSTAGRTLGVEADGDLTKVNTLDGHTAQTADHTASLSSLTTQIGTAGDGLTAIPWNAAWNAEVQSEATDALNAYDPPTRTEATADKDEVLAILGTPVGADMSADIAQVKIDTAATVTDTNELQTDWANGGRLDLILDARASQTSVDDVDAVVDLILADTGTGGVVLSSATANQIADALLNRDVTNVEDTAAKHSVGAMVIIGTNSSISGTTLTASKPSDDSTFQTYTITVDAGADPITGIS